MATFHDLTTAQLKQAVKIREQLEALQAKLTALLGGAATSSGLTKGRRTMSAATKKKMAAAQQARWAHVRSPADEPVKPVTKKASPVPMVARKKGGITAAGRAKLSAAMKARWAARKKGAPAPNAPAN